MSKKIVFAFSLFLSFNLLSGQTKDILLTIEGENVTTEEFLKLYNKNLDLVKDESQKKLDNYLELFINYKLKLKEAKRLGLDEDANYKREFENYKKQLTKNYLSDNKVTDAMVEEAYERSAYDVKASHILILDDPKVQDTLVAYNKLLDYRKVLKNEGFESAKAKLHDGEKVLVEDLGYFSAFKMVYDFESKAYNTKPGEVSMPFKTQFGYHVVRVDEKRKSQGSVTVAHIMVSEQQKDSTLNIKERIDDIYKKLQQKESFDAMAKQFSDDKSSARNGGKIRSFKRGNLSSPEFENAAFALEDIGDITKPIKTKFGWHIIKLIKKEPIKPFVDLRPTLEAQVKRDARSKLINSAMVKKLESRYTIDKNQSAISYFEPILNNGYLQGKFNLPENYNGNVEVIKINGRIFTNNDFLQHLKTKQRQYMRNKTSIVNVLNNEFKTFYENSVLKFREENLVNENQEFADILKEYKDGLLLFALMEQEIWNKASKDSTGLQAFYDLNSSKYQWERRVEATIASGSSKTIIEEAKTMFSNGKSIEDIKSQLNTVDNQNIIFTIGVFEKSNQKLPKNLPFQKGVSKVYEHNENYHVINIEKVLPEGIKTLKEARGSVINDYQNKIEKDWLRELRDRFEVKLDDKVLKRLKKQIGQ